LDKYCHSWNTSNNMSSLYLCLPKTYVLSVLMSPYSVIFPIPMSFLYWYPPYTNILCTLICPSYNDMLSISMMSLFWYPTNTDIHHTLMFPVSQSSWPLKAGHASSTWWISHILQNFIILINTITNPYLGLHESKSGDKAEPIP